MKTLLFSLCLLATVAGAQTVNPSFTRSVAVDGVTIIGTGTPNNPLQSISTPATPFNCEATGTDAGSNKTCNVVRTGRVKAPQFAASAMPTQSAASPYRELVYDTATGLIAAAPIVNNLTDVLGNTVATPPATPAVDDAYIVPAGATGAWAGQTNKIAKWSGAAWTFYTPANNDATTVTTGANAGNRYVFNGGVWAIIAATTSPNWVLGGNNIAVNTALGSSSNVDWRIVRAGATKATVTNNGITLPNNVGLWALNSSGVAGRIAVANSANVVHVGAVDAAYVATVVGSGTSNASTALGASGATKYVCSSAGCTLFSGTPNVSGFTTNLNANSPTSGQAGTAGVTTACVNNSGNLISCTPAAAPLANYLSVQNNGLVFTLPSKQITYRGSTGAAAVTLPACVLGDWATFVQEGAGAVITYNLSVRNNGVANTVYTGSFKHQLVCGNSGFWTVIN